MQIYLARNNVQAGPYTLDELNRMLASGQVQPDDLIWHEGMSQWQSVGTVTGGQPVYQPAGHAAPAPLSLQKPAATPNTPARVASGLPPAKNLTISSLYKRISAALLDMCLFFLCLLPVLRQLDMDAFAGADLAAMENAMQAVPTQDMLVAMLLLLLLGLTQCVLTVRRGQSVGKLLLGTRIVDPQTGAVPSVRNVLLIRTLLFSLFYNIPTLGLVLLIADTVAMLMSNQRQSLHDRAARTVVVDVEPQR